MLPLLTALAAPLITAFSARSARQGAIAAKRLDLIGSTDSNNHSWEIAALAGEGWELPLIRFMAYVEVTLCTLLAIYEPAKATELWLALSAIPEWLLGMKLTIFGWAFASTPIKAAAGGLVSVQSLKATATPRAKP